MYNVSAADDGYQQKKRGQSASSLRRHGCVCVCVCVCVCAIQRIFPLWEQTQANSYLEAVLVSRPCEPRAGLTDCLVIRGQVLNGIKVICSSYMRTLSLVLACPCPCSVRHCNVFFCWFLGVGGGLVFFCLTVVQCGTVRHYNVYLSVCRLVVRCGAVRHCNMYLSVCRLVIRCGAVRHCNVYLSLCRVVVRCGAVRHCNMYLFVCPLVVRCGAVRTCKVYVSVSSCLMCGAVRYMN